MILIQIPRRLTKDSKEIFFLKIISPTPAIMPSSAYAAKALRLLVMPVKSSGYPCLVIRDMTDVRVARMNDTHKTEFTEQRDLSKSGEKKEKDISDFFLLGHTELEFRELVQKCITK